MLRPDAGNEVKEDSALVGSQIRRWAEPGRSPGHGREGELSGGSSRHDVAPDQEVENAVPNAF